MMTFDPFAQFEKGLAMFQKLQEEAIARATSFYGEVDKLESKGVERSTAAIDELSNLGKESLAYSVQIHAEWRKMTMDAFKSATAAFAVKPST